MECCLLMLGVIVVVILIGHPEERCVKYTRCEQCGKPSCKCDKLEHCVPQPQVVPRR